MNNLPESTNEPVEVYARPARFFHWLTVFLLLIQVPVGFIMVYRGKELKIWDSLTGDLYSTHKLLGVIILAFIVLRLLYRLAKGAPREPATLASWQRVVSQITHWSIYVMLLVVPVLGYFGTAMFPALKIFDWFELPALVGKDREMSDLVLYYHAVGAFILLGLVVLHISAALYHRFFLKDTIVARMWPGSGNKRA